MDEAQLRLFARYLTPSADKVLIEHSSHMCALARGLTRRFPRKQGAFPSGWRVFF